MTHVMQVPIALVSLVDKDRQWFKAKCGLSVCETSRDLAFCAHAILQKVSKVFLVPDATKDPRFMNSDLVLGPPHIRFYAGAPLEYTDEDGQQFKLGTLCIIDVKPRVMTDEQLIILKVLARLVVAEIQLREKMAKENAMAIASADAGATSKAQGLNAQYISQVAHDLRTPLNSFLLGMQALRDSELSEEQDGVLATMEVAGQLMHLTCTKALDYNQMEGGRALAAQRKLFNLVEMLDRSLVVVMGYTHESKDVHYEYILDDDVSAHIISDEDFVWQMYMNILCNARKFTTKGHIHTYLSVVKAPWALEGALPKYGEGTDVPADDDDSPFLKFTVSDTGIGVPDDQKEKLFQPFGQLQEFSGGTGLGLWSVLEKVKSLGGRCGMCGNEPQGSVFWFAIPYVPARGPPKRTMGLAARRTSSSRLVHSAGNIAVARPGSIVSERRYLGPVVTSMESCDDSGDEDVDACEEDQEEKDLWLSKRRASRKCDGETVATDSFRSIRALRNPPEQRAGVQDADAQSAAPFRDATPRSGKAEVNLNCTRSIVQHWLHEMGAGESLMQTFYEESIDVEALAASTRQDLTILGVKQYGLQTKLLARARREQHVQDQRFISHLHASSSSSLGHDSSFTRMFTGAKSHGSSTMSAMSLATTHDASTGTFESLCHDSSAASMKEARAGLSKAGASTSPASPSLPAVAGEGIAHRIAAAAEQSAAAAPASAGPGKGSGVKEILIVEDDVPTRALMVHGLKKRGFIVHQAGNGAEGLEMMKSRLFDMVLSDIMMPVMDGLECVKRLRAWEAEQGAARPKQFVCALSANTGPADVEKVKAADICDFYPKPVKMGQLLAFLEGKFMVLAAPKGDT